MAKCEDCGATFDGTLKGTWRQVVGYVVERDGGGPNQVREKVETGRVICPPCGTLRASGVDRNQGAML